MRFRLRTLLTMDENPYKSPQESGYDPPRMSLWELYCRHRRTLTLAALAFWAFVFWMKLVAWLIGLAV